VSKRKKRIETLRRRANFTADELDTILTHDFGCISRQHGTSHKTYRHPDGRKVTIPQDRPHIKRVYIDEVLEMFGAEVEAIEGEGDDE
jgi:predicted RNA binding protein YcfA (HicA-like mRNA interferase family)